MIDRLPIGSVVTIKNEIKKVMILGYSDNNYIGILYPVGYINKDQNIIFTKDDIIKVLFLGYQEG